jgi:ferredoxin
MMAAPEVFHVTEDGMVQLKQEYPEESLRDKVEESARLCPVQAIVIDD